MTNLPPKPKHLDVQVEGDLVVVRTSGTIDESVARYIGALHDELAVSIGYALELQYCHESTTLTHEARHSYFKWNRKRQFPGAVAVVGASFATKTMAMLLTRAVKLAVVAHTEMKFFDTEAEARAWLDEQRTLIKSLLASKKSLADR